MPGQIIIDLLVGSPFHHVVSDKLIGTIGKSSVIEWYKLLLHNQQLLFRRQAKSQPFPALWTKIVSKLYNILIPVKFN